MNLVIGKFNHKIFEEKGPWCFSGLKNKEIIDEYELKKIPQLDIKDLKTKIAENIEPYLNLKDPNYLQNLPSIVGVQPGISID